MKKMDFQFYQNGRQKIAIFCPSAWFSKNFFLYYFTASYIILNLLESYCKLQHMYSTLKWHQDVLFWVPETPESLLQRRWDVFRSKVQNNFCNEDHELFGIELLRSSYDRLYRLSGVSGTQNSTSWSLQYLSNKSNMI